ncbi:MAG: chemotaxis protein CheW [Eubacterium sp.]|nr:chemotaxis protein CheW [Eubacterium sp.]
MSETNLSTETDLGLSLDVHDDQKGKYMTFKCGHEFFGLKIQYVNEIIQIQTITPVPETEDYIKGLINLRGKIIPVVDMRLRFGLEAVEYTDRTCIIVVNYNSTMVGLIVESIAEVAEITDDDILPPPTMSRTGQANRKYVYGIGKVGESVKLLLDPDKLLNDDDASAAEQDKINEEE